MYGVVSGIFFVEVYTMEERLSASSILYPENIAGLHVTWTFASKGELTAPALVVDNRVYVGSQDQHLYALDVETGHQIWTYVTRRRIVSAPIFADGIIYVTSLDGSVTALEASGG